MASVAIGAEARTEVQEPTKAGRKERRSAVNQTTVEVHKIRQIREITLKLSQLRIKRESEAQRRTEEDRVRAEQERQLQRDLIHLTVEEKTQ